MNVRAAAALALAQITADGRSLDSALASWLPRLTERRDRALLQQLCYGALRWYPRLAAVRTRLLRQPLKAADADVAALLLVGLYQLLYLRIPTHAAVAETVNASRELRKGWAAGLINAVLRNFLRQREPLLIQVDQDPAAATGHPPWLLQRLREDWPEQWEQIVAANNLQPPLSLRVNRRQLSRGTYLECLAEQHIAARILPHAPDALVLEEPRDVADLPGFAAGWASVQDAAAQLAAPLLELAPGQRVLDACAAPGGKAAHMLECEPRLGALVALDRSDSRLQRVTENLERLHLRAELRVGDVLSPADWWDGEPFDRILLDAPCSATGVIRRHPDIKLLRRAADIAELASRQARMLSALWPMLRRGGMLVYATCSVLRQENEQVALAWLRSQGDAALELPIEAQWGLSCPAGRQILPGEHDMDGFYYFRVQKR